MNKVYIYIYIYIPCISLSISLSLLPWSAAPSQASCSAATSFPQWPWRYTASWRSWRSWWRRRCHWRRRRAGSWHTVEGIKGRREGKSFGLWLLGQKEKTHEFFLNLFWSIAIYVAFTWWLIIWTPTVPICYSRVSVGQAAQSVVRKQKAERARVTHVSCLWRCSFARLCEWF